MKKSVIFIIIVILVLTVIAFFYSFRQMTAPEQHYESAVVAMGDVSKTINVDATLQPDSHVDIATEIPTLIEWVGVEVNDEVEKGDAILRLDKDAVNAQVKNAQLAVERAELAEQQARRQWDKMKPEERESIKKATEQSRQILNEVYSQAKKTTITSSIDGIVIKQNARVGEVATGVLVRIIDPESLRVEALIPEVDLSRVKIGSTTRIILDAYPEIQIMGEVEMIEMGNIELQGNTYYKAILIMDSGEDIDFFDGMNAEVDIEFDREEGVLVIPRAFVQKDDQGYFVHIIDTQHKGSGDPVQQYFSAGLIGDENVEVVSGLAKGQSIILVTPEDQ